MHSLLQPFTQVLGIKTIERIGIIWTEAGISEPPWLQLQKHMQLVAASAYSLARLLPVPDANALIEAGLLHDVFKRREIEKAAPTNWTMAEVAEYAKRQVSFLESHKVSPEVLQIISAHGSEVIFELVIHAEKVPLSQQLFLYADNICGSKGFVTLRERIERLRNLYPVLNDLAAYGFFTQSTFGFYDLQLHVMRLLELRLASNCSMFSGDLYYSVCKNAADFLNGCH